MLDFNLIKIISIKHTKMHFNNKNHNVFLKPHVNLLLIKVK